MPVPPDDFAALIARASAGDAAAQSELVRRYESRVRLVARVLLGKALQPYLDSMDLVQSVHRSLLIGLRGGKFVINTPEELMALARLMVRRKAARQWRHMRRQQRLESGSSTGGNLPELLLSLHSTEADPARAAQLGDAVRRLCDRLSDTERRHMEMRMDGHTNPEIAAELGLSDVALRVQLTRLRKRLRAEGVFDEWL
jgi:RNA polymerase sigma-70 factor (ECF subfamily)